jgi:hypothetical protein
VKINFFGAFLLSSLGVFAQDNASLTAIDVKTAKAKPAPRATDKHPDLTGYWNGTRETKFAWNIAKDQPGMRPPLTAAGEAALKHNQTATIDPESLCIIGGTPRHNVSMMPFEVLQTAKKIAFLYSDGAFRLIPIDAARKHSKDPDPTFFGEEIGHWEGDTLVIDSIAFKDEKIWIDEYANPSSDALHVIERWSRPDAGHIHVETLVDDPKFYTKTFTYARTWVAGPPGEELIEFSCSENNVDEKHLGFGPGPVLNDGTIGYDDPAPLPPPIPRR